MNESAPASRLREQPRTRRARSAVIAAARARFLAHGYTATSIAEISADAAVAPATVYRLFGGKVGIVMAVLDVAIAGDEASTPVAARPAVRAAVAATRGEDVITGFVGVTAAINGRIAALYRVLTQAADADGEARSLLETLNAQRGRGQALLVDALVSGHVLRSGLAAERAADVVHALMSPELFRSLVGERGWTPDAYADWLTRTLCDQLL